MTISELNINSDNRTIDEVCEGYKSKISDLSKKLLELTKQLVEINRNLAWFSDQVNQHLYSLSNNFMGDVPLSQLLQDQKEYEKARVRCHQRLARWEKECNTYEKQLQTYQKACGALPSIPEPTAREKRARRIFEKALSCRVIKDLYAEALFTPNPYNGDIIGPWSLLLNTEASYPAFKFCNAYCAIERRYICVKENIDDDMAMTFFVFELTNAIKSVKFFEINLQLIKGQINREDYVISLEYLEHEGIIQHHCIMSSAIQEKGWSSSLDIYKDKIEPFEVYWAQIKDSAHANDYRAQWDQIQELYHQQISDQKVSF